MNNFSFDLMMGRRPPEEPKKTLMQQRQIVWRWVGYFAHYEVDEIRLNQRCSKQRCVSVSDGVKLTYRCNRWKTCRCKYLMFAHFDTKAPDSRANLYESGRHEHYCGKRGKNVLAPKMKTQLVDGLGTTLPKGRRTGGATKNVSMSSIASTSSANETHDALGPGRLFDETEDDIEDEELDVGVNEVAPLPTTINGLLQPYYQTAPLPNNAGSSSLFGHLATMIRIPKNEAMVEIKDSDVSTETIMTPSRIEMEDQRNSSRSSVAPSEPEAKPQTSQYTAASPSGRFSLGDADTLMKLLALSNQLGVNLQFNSGRPEEILLKSKRDDRRAFGIFVQDKGDVVEVSRQENGQDFEGREAWIKADWAQFAWAVRGICVDFL